MLAYLVTDSAADSHEGGLFVMIIAENANKAKSEATKGKMDHEIYPEDYIYLRAKRIKDR